MESATRFITLILQFSSSGVQLLVNLKKSSILKVYMEQIVKFNNMIDEIEKRIFERSKNKNDNLDVQRFIRAIRKTGLKLSDPRLTDVRTNLDNCQNFIIENVDEETIDTGIDFDCFKGKNMGVVRNGETRRDSP